MKTASETKSERYSGAEKFRRTYLGCPDHQATRECIWQLDVADS